MMNFRQGCLKIFVEIGYPDIVDHLLDPLLLGFGADEKHIAGIGHNIVFQAVGHH